jgi:hypothetical protein
MSELEPSPRFYTRRVGGAVAAYGEIDVAAMLARIVEIGWGRVAGLRFEPSRAATGVVSAMEPQ